MKTSTKLLSYFVTAGVMALSPFSAFATEGSGTNGLSFYDYLAANADKETVIDFNEAPATGDIVDETRGGLISDIGGLYMLQETKDDEKPMYFYRGNVENNNVILNDFCWLIVRTTETGGVKLLYNGRPDGDGVCVGGADDGGFMDHQTIYTSPTRDESLLPNTLIATSYFNEQSKSPADMGYMYGERIEAYRFYLEGNIRYYFGNDVTFDNGVYTLTDPVPLTRNSNLQLNEEERRNVENGHHYSCFTTSTSCETVYYISSLDDASNVYSIPLSGGYNIDGALAKMAENKNDSLVKQIIEDWYADNLSSVTDLLEDTVWYAGKSFGSGVLSSKDADTNNGFDDKNVSFTQPFIDTFYNGVSRGDSITLPMIRPTSDFFPNLGEFRFGITNQSSSDESSTQIDYLAREDVNATPSFNYSEAENRFTVAEENGNGLLEYPVGMLTISEMMMAGNGFPGYARGTYLDDDELWWGMTPIGFNFYAGFAGASAYYAITGYSFDGAGVNYLDMGVRPAVSLKSTLGANSGDGSRENPFTALAEVAESDDEEPPAEGEAEDEAETPVNPQTSDAIMKVALLGIIGALPILIARKELKKR